MTFFECLVAFISTNSPLAAKLTGGLHPQIVPQNPILVNGVIAPLLVMRLISGSSEHPTHDGGASPWSMVRIELTVYGADFKTQEQAALMLDSMFSSFNGYLGGGSSGRFSTGDIHGPRSIQDPSTRLVGIQLDILGMLNRSTLS